MKNGIKNGIKEIIFKSALALVTLCQIPFYFIKFFFDVGVLPGIDAEGNHVISDKFYRYYNAFERLCDVDAEWIMYVNFALIAASVVLTALSMIFKKKTLNMLTILVIFLSFMFFFGGLYMASTVHRAF